MQDAPQTTPAGKLTRRLQDAAPRATMKIAIRARTKACAPTKVYRHPVCKREELAGCFNGGHAGQVAVVLTHHCLASLTDQGGTHHGMTGEGGRSANETAHQHPHQPQAPARRRRTSESKKASPLGKVRRVWTLSLFVSSRRFGKEMHEQGENGDIKASCSGPRPNREPWAGRGSALNERHSRHTARLLRCPVQHSYRVQFVASACVELAHTGGEHMCCAALQLAMRHSRSAKHVRASARYVTPFLTVLPAL